MAAVECIVSNLDLECSSPADIQTAIKNLQSWKLCVRCVLRFLGEKSHHVYRNELGDLKEALNILSMGENHDLPKDPKASNGNSNTTHNSTHESASHLPLTEDESNKIDEDDKAESKDSAVTETTKKATVTDQISECGDVDNSCTSNSTPETVCIGCLGILSQHCDDTFLDKIKETVLESGYEISSFSCSVTTPISLILREHSILLALKQILPSVYGHVTMDSLVAVKDVWKWSVGSKLASKIVVPFEYKSPFGIFVNFVHENSNKECNFLCDVFPHDFKKRKTHKYKFELFSRNNVTKAVQQISDKQFTRNYCCPANMTGEVCGYDEIKCSQDPIYVAGRYNKYNRSLSQTPWWVEGVRKGETSVEELICELLVASLKSEDYKFSSAGREDVDVQMLGTGRPFVVEFINPHRVTFCQEEITQIQKDINNSTKDIQVRDLQIVTKEDTQVLKQGEEEKTKTYTALCWVKEEVTQEQLDDTLSGIKDLTLAQKTPIRVLHRRPLAVRDRTIHSMSASLINPHHFRLRLFTQAGTYIKEFVHGDFGRTVPNLGSLLNTECDILELDVESVELAWPKPIEV